MIRLRSWKHRYSGRVVMVFGRTWTLEVTVAPRRIDRHGRGWPFDANLHTHLKPGP